MTNISRRAGTAASGTHSRVVLAQDADALGMQLVGLLLARGRFVPFAVDRDGHAGRETGQSADCRQGTHSQRSPTHPAACSGLMTTCNGASDEPSPTAAKATRFCLRTERTQPSTRTRSPWRGRCSRRATDEASRTV